MTETPFDETRVDELPLAEVMEARSNRMADRPVFFDTKGTLLTYGRLATLAHYTRTMLVHLGLGRNDVVLSLGGTHPLASVVDFLLSQSTTVMVLPGPVDRGTLDHLVTATGAAAIVGCAPLRPVARATAQGRGLTALEIHPRTMGGMQLFTIEALGRQPRPGGGLPTADDPAFIFLAPDPVRPDRTLPRPLTHRHLLLCAADLRDRLDLRPRDRGVVQLDPHERADLHMTIVATILSGSAMMVCPPETPLLEAAPGEATWCSAAAATWRSLLAGPGRTGDGTSSLRLARSHGGNLDREESSALTSLVGVPVIQSFGDPGCPMITSTGLDPDEPCEGSVGRPALVEVKISAEGKDVAAPRVVGRIHYRWPGEDESFRATAHRGWWDEKGFLYLVDD